MKRPPAARAEAWKIMERAAFSLHKGGVCDKMTLI